MKKLLLSILFSCLVGIPTFAYDFSQTINGTTFYFNIISEGVELTYRDTNYNSYSGYVNIPVGVAYNGKTYLVKSIGNCAFYGCSGLTSVTIGNSVTSIGRSAFCGCSSLTSVTIPDNVTSIGDHAFNGCSGLTSVDIPNSVTSIGNYAFNGTALYNDGSNWDNNVLYISNCLIEADEKLSGAYAIKDNTRVIANSAFYYSDLTSVTIPNSVTSIGDSAFFKCTGLTSVTIPDSVTAIGNDAFYYCDSLTSVTIGNSVTSIGYHAFVGTALYNDNSNWYNNVLYISNCLIEADEKLSGAYSIKNNTRVIADSAFLYCSGLTSVTIPNSVTAIGNDAFEDCNRLTAVTIGNSVTYIGDFAFGCCISLKSFYGKFASDDNRCLIVDGILNSFAPSGVRSYTIPNSVTSIGNQAFHGCSSLTSVTIPNSVTSIGNCAFYDCRGLTSVTIPNSVTSIGGYAFYGCSGLTSVIIPDSVISINYRAFYGCTGLTSVTIPNSVTSIGQEAFDGCTGLTSVTIPNSVTSIGQEAFYGCTGLTSATIGNSVTSIGEKAFSFCSGLTDVTIPDSVTKIGDGAFYRCSGLSSFSGKFASYDHRCLIIEGILNGFAPSGLTSYIIPNSVTTIGRSAFKYCTGLTSVTIPNSVTSIGQEAFYGCTGLISVKVVNDNPANISLGGNVFSNVPTSTCVLYVPKGSKALYAEADQWKNFKNIVEFDSAMMGDVSGDGVVNVADITATIEAILNTGDTAADVNGDGRVDVSDITHLINIILGDNNDTPSDKDWKSIGTVTITDDFVASVFIGVSPLSWDVEIQEHSTQNGYYRIINPYATFLYADLETYVYSKDFYMYIHAEDPNNVWIPAFETGLDFGYGMIKVTSTAGYYIEEGGYSFEDVVEAGVPMGVLADGILRFPKDSFFVAMANYQGGEWWWYGNSNEKFSVVWPQQSPEWEQVGTFNYNDGLIPSLLLDEEPYTYPVAVEHSTIDAGLYRMVNPYKAGICPYGMEYEEDVYVELDATNPDCVVVPLQYIGLADEDMGQIYMLNYAYLYKMNGVGDDFIIDAGYNDTYSNGVFTFNAPEFDGSPESNLIVCFPDIDPESLYVSNSSSFLSMTGANSVAQHVAAIRNDIATGSLKVNRRATEMMSKAMKQRKMVKNNNLIR